MAPSWLITAMSYNDYYLLYPWYYIVYYLLIWPMSYALCNYGLTYAYSFLSSIVTPQLAGSAQIQACMKGSLQMTDYWYFKGFQSNQVIDFKV
jgi:hypothetical protein